MTTFPDALHRWPARALAAAIRERRVSAVEVMRAHLDRIDQLNDSLHAIVSPLPRRTALAMAGEADRAVARGDELGPLHGLPTAVKDLVDVAGLPTVHGSAVHADAPPATHDSVLAERLRGAGALIIGKTNTPEMGLGTLTFNPVFGTTRNPWDLTRHAGGSSGGAAAAVASGMLPIADGSDSGGSIRYPAAFCNVVGLRPTPGAVPSGRPGNAWSPHGVLGPMARDSADAALLLSGIAGHDPRWPLSWIQDPYGLARLDELDLRGLRLAWSADVGGLPIDPDIRAAHARARAALESAGAAVVDREPDFSHADRAWETIEMFEFFSYGHERVDALSEAARADYREDFLRNVEQGRVTSARALAEAFARRTDLFRDTARLLADVDALVLPATPVPPPLAELEWVPEIDGVRFDRYFRWQLVANRITATGHPALVTPGGFTEAGLPVGLQVVGPSRGDARLLAIGAAIETAIGLVGRAPAAIPG
ncbi:amidase family protein [Acrocarpospora sp. B8E8]|uniref:amidase n=1 Tax=Acrocarpospora sp. B8E8 TaxID=3153572 RepID=UPI00325DA250